MIYRQKARETLLVLFCASLPLLLICITQRVARLRGQGGNSAAGKIHGKVAPVPPPRLLRLDVSSLNVVCAGA